MQICTLTQTHNHASFLPLSFLQARCPSCCPTNSLKALKAHTGTGRTSVNIGVNANLELVDKFCYLGDMLSVDGDADAAVIKIRIGWNKFRQLVPLLTNKDISLIVKGRLYSSCVWSNTLHGSETWLVRKKNEVALQRAEMRMVRWMCGIKLQDRVLSKGLRERLGLDDMISVLQQNRLRWYGHVLRKEDND